jgi:uncharacterized membrane protein (UPF0127 family)
MAHPIRIGDQWVPARVADDRLSRARGHMFRPTPPDWALVFPFDEAEDHRIHMLFVPFALEVAFVVDGIVQRVERLSPWVGVASGDADTIIELPAGAFHVTAGDTVEVSL